MYKVKTFLLWIPLILITLSCGNQKQTSDFKSEEPQKIISLAPSITEELYLLGVQKKILGVTIFCTHPPEARRKEKVGTYLEPNLEKIVALRPDVVLATENQKKETLRKLEDLGIKTYIFPEGNSFKEITEQFFQLAKIVGEERKAKQIVELTEKRIKELILRNKKHSPVKVFVQLGSEPLVTCGKNTFINEIVELVGEINIVNNPGSGVNRSGSHQGYFRINREKVIQENPEVIFIISMGETSGKEVKTWSKFKSLKAVKEKRIYLLDADKICRPTVTCYLEGLETISRVLR